MKKTAPAPNLLKKKVDSFKGKKVLVWGDLILDQFIWGKVDRISPEAPVPVVVVDKESYMPGGALNVANNIRTLGGEVFTCGVVGDDENGQRLAKLLEEKGLDTEGVIVDASRPTTLKTRIIAHGQQVVRVDREDDECMCPPVLKRMLSYLLGIIPSIDAVIVEDYGKGVIVPQLLGPVLKSAKRHGKIITVDPKKEHFKFYKGVTAITPNRQEAEIAAGMKLASDEELKEGGFKILKKLNCKAVLITLGEGGMQLFESGGRSVHIPTVAQEVYDVSGAGDTVIGTFTLALASKANLYEAAHISNCAAGVVVGKVGIATVNPHELKERIDMVLNHKSGTIWR